MMNFCIFLGLVSVGFTHAELWPSCSATLSSAGISKNFNETIAHAIHSMTVQGLKMFNKKATENNSIPTVNSNLKEAMKVVPFAPDKPLGNDFVTHSMNSIDAILSKLGRSDDGLGPNWSPLERIAHNFHMWDLWVKIHELYWSQIVSSPPGDEVCDCLLDVDNNGVKAAVGWVADHYKTGTPITLLNRPIPKLTDAKTWSVWKNRLVHYYTKPALRDAAMYMHCATRHF